MRSRLVGAWGAGCVVLAVAGGATAAPVTFSGTVSYGAGGYSGDSLYVAVMYIENEGLPTLFGYVAMPAPAPPFGLPYAVPFDNAGAPGPLAVMALLDVDGTGFDPDSLEDALTEPDVLGWYDGQQDPVRIDPSTSQAGLAFALPLGEIRGEVIFAPGQTWAEVVPVPVPDGIQAKLASRTAPGPFDVVGLYDGDYIVLGFGWDDGICWGDSTGCAHPDTLTITGGATVSGVILDFNVTAVRGDSWGRIKALYR